MSIRLAAGFEDPFRLRIRGVKQAEKLKEHRAATQIERIKLFSVARNVLKKFGKVNTELNTEDILRQIRY